MRVRATRLRLIGFALAASLTACCSLTAYRIFRAEPQMNSTGGLYPGGVFLQVRTAQASSPPTHVGGGPFPPVPLATSLTRYGERDRIYYDRYSVTTPPAPSPPPPPGWGEAITTGNVRVVPSPELAAAGLDRVSVDWRLIGSSGVWRHTVIHWSAVSAVAMESVLPGLLLGCVAAALFMGVVHIRHRMRQSTNCVACGYDRSGLTGEARCPECGTNQPLHSSPNARNK